MEYKKSVKAIVYYCNTNQPGDLVVPNPTSASVQVAIQTLNFNFEKE